MKILVTGGDRHTGTLINKERYRVGVSPRRDAAGRFIRTLKPWSLECFEEGFISHHQTKPPRFWVYLPNHPRRNVGGYVQRSIVAYEQYHNTVVSYKNLVHHVNLDTLDDSKENLILLSRREHRREHARLKGQLLERTCEFCKGVFEINAYRLREKGSNRGRFCSQQCYHDYKVGPNHHNYLRVTTNCYWCGLAFEHIPSQKRRFCSRRCSARFTWTKRRG